jgi:hypothetical protein
MHADANIPDVVDDAVDQRDSELQLLGGILSRGERGAHEGPGSRRRERKLAEHRLVQLDEVGALPGQCDDLLAQQGDHVLRQIFFRPIRCRSPRPRTWRA